MHANDGPFCRNRSDTNQRLWYNARRPRKKTDYGGGQAVTEGLNGWAKRRFGGGDAVAAAQPDIVAQVTALREKLKQKQMQKQMDRDTKAKELAEVVAARFHQQLTSDEAILRLFPRWEEEGEIPKLINFPISFDCSEFPVGVKREDVLVHLRNHLSLKKLDHFEWTHYSDDIVHPELEKLMWSKSFCKNYLIAEPKTDMVHRHETGQYLPVLTSEVVFSTKVSGKRPMLKPGHYAVGSALCLSLYLFCAYQDLPDRY